VFPHVSGDKYILKAVPASWDLLLLLLLLLRAIGSSASSSSAAGDAFFVRATSAEAFAFALLRGKQLNISNTRPRTASSFLRSFNRPFRRPHLTQCSSLTSTNPAEEQARSGAQSSRPNATLSLALSELRDPKRSRPCAPYMTWLNQERKARVLGAHGSGP